MTTRRPLVAGNWKMNGLKSSAGELDKLVKAAGDLVGLDLMVCPPANMVAQAAARAVGS